MGLDPSIIIVYLRVIFSAQMPLFYSRPVNSPVSGTGWSLTRARPIALLLVNSSTL